MNFTKFLRTRILHNSSGGLLLKINTHNSQFWNVNRITSLQQFVPTAAYPLGLATNKVSNNINNK